jgi:radical SAM superfamily enzyme YgiQ (UPF0313 family)
VGKEMQNQSSQWLNVRRDRPDYMIMWGWGAMNPTAIKEAVKIRYPMDKFTACGGPQAMMMRQQAVRTLKATRLSTSHALAVTSRRSG